MPYVARSFSQRDLILIPVATLVTGGGTRGSATLSVGSGGEGDPPSPSRAMLHPPSGHGGSDASREVGLREVEYGESGIDSPGLVEYSEHVALR